MSKIEILIKEVANNKLAGKYNLAQYKEGAKRHGEKLAAMAHKKVCEDIVAFTKAHSDIPMYFVLSVGVSKGAYKEDEFKRGYKAFDANKVLAVAKMGRAYLDYNEQYNKKVADVVIRLIMRYYERVSKDWAKFLVDLNNSKVLGKGCCERACYDTLCKNLGI